MVRETVVDKVPVQIDGHTLTLSNLTKVLYPADGFTKAEVLDYYQRISAVLLPHIAGPADDAQALPGRRRRRVVLRQARARHRPDSIRTEDVESRSSRSREPGATVSYLVIDDLAALIWAANLAGLELHVPMWRFPGREPDLLVFDLDPGLPATVVDCCRVAEELRPLLEDEGLRPLPKTSGGKGLQLYAAISGLTAEQASARAKALAERMEEEHPGQVVSRMTRSLREGKVLIDWSQNNGSKTTIAPYSLRARTHPTVSTPVTWDEVAACRKTDDLFFTAPDVLARVDAHGDLFAPLLPSPTPEALRSCRGEHHHVRHHLQQPVSGRRAGVRGLCRRRPREPAELRLHRQHVPQSGASEHRALLRQQRGRARRRGGRGHPWRDPGLVHAATARGIQRPCIYANASTMQGSVLPVLSQAKIARSSVRLWSAHYGLGEHICGPSSCGALSIEADGTQWTSSALGRVLDQSELQSNFFTVSPPRRRYRGGGIAIRPAQHRQERADEYRRRAGDRAPHRLRLRQQPSQAQPPAVLRVAIYDTGPGWHVTKNVVVDGTKGLHVMAFPNPAKTGVISVIRTDAGGFPVGYVVY